MYDGGGYPRESALSTSEALDSASVLDLLTCGDPRGSGGAVPTGFRGTVTVIWAIRGTGNATNSDSMYLSAMMIVLG